MTDIYVFSLKGQPINSMKLFTELELLRKQILEGHKEVSYLLFDEYLKWRVKVHLRTLNPTIDNAKSSKSLSASEIKTLLNFT